jgi:hypothetical protein
VGFACAHRRADGDAAHEFDGLYVFFALADEDVRRVTDEVAVKEAVAFLVAGLGEVFVRLAMHHAAVRIAVIPARREDCAGPVVIEEIGHRQPSGAKDVGCCASSVAADHDAVSVAARPY